MSMPIPGPRWPAPVQVFVTRWRFPTQYIRYAERYGGIYQLRLLLPRQPPDPSGWPLINGKIVMVDSPALLREICTTAAPGLAGGQGRRFTEWILGPRSLMVLDGEPHLAERRLLLSLFTPERLQRAEAAMREAVTAAIARLEPGDGFSLSAFFDEIGPELSARLMFGPVDRDTVARLRAGALGGFASLAWSTPALLFPWLRRDLGPWSPGGKSKKVLAEFRGILADQRRRIQSSGNGEGWFSHLLALEEPSDAAEAEALRLSRVLTLFGASDVPAGALSWCCYHLLLNPAVLARVSEEVRASGPLPPDQRPYLEAVCKEALRINSPVAVLTRRVIAPVQLGEYALEPGSYVVGAIFMAHRRPEVFADPHAFRPERFLERSFSPYEYLPFGGGTRRCLGQSVGFRQMAIVLAELLRNFDLIARGPYRATSVRRAVMFLPKDPLRVELRRASPP